MDMEKLIKIVAALSQTPAEGININSIAKESGISIASTYRILKIMERKNEALKEKSGNNIFYRLNLKNSFARKYAEMASIKKREFFFLKRPEYYDLLMSLKNSIKEYSSIVGVFGSMARMEKKPRDIDVLIVYKTDLKQIQKNISKTGISPFYITEQELKEKIKEKIIANIIKDAILLHGECEFWNILSEAV